jgi:ABC-2 type transport system permease protein
LTERVDNDVAPQAPARGFSSSAVAGFYTLFYKEWLRFWKVAVQTVLAPVLSALLFLLVFGHTLRGSLDPYPGVSYGAFLAPGLAMMSILQNAFANASSSLMQSKMTGNIVFILLPPLAPREFFLAYLLAAAARGLICGAGVLLCTVWFFDLGFAHPAWIVVFAVLGSAIMGALGIIAGLHADKMDQLAAFQNFVVLPLTFLSGVFYSIHSLPPFWQGLSHLNPFFYVIDGFRYGFFGVSDVSPPVSAATAGVSCLALAWLTLWLIRIGYKLRG